MKTAGSSLAQLFFVSDRQSATISVIGANIRRTFMEVDVPVPAGVTQYGR